MCEKETTPILNMSIPLQGSNDHKYFAIAKEVIESMKFPINFLNITTLSECRKDAHPSFYGLSTGKSLSPKQKSDPANYADCVHWCVPGLPDTWNELIYTYITDQY